MLAGARRCFHHNERATKNYPSNGMEREGQPCTKHVVGWRLAPLQYRCYPDCYLGAQPATRLRDPVHFGRLGAPSSSNTASTPYSRRDADIQVGDIYLTCTSTIEQKFDAANETARRMVPSPMWVASVPGMVDTAQKDGALSKLYKTRVQLPRIAVPTAEEGGSTPHLLPHRPWSQRAHR